MGRTGRFFAFTKFGLQPDIVVVAKPLAAGLPLAAILAREEVAQAFSPGMHGTTFGGGPLQCRLALKVLEILERPGFLAHVQRGGSLLPPGTGKVAGGPSGDSGSARRRVDGGGGIARPPGKSVVRQALEAGLLMNCTQEKVLRFLPPLIIEKQHVDEAIGILRPVLAALEPAADDEGGKRIMAVMTMTTTIKKPETLSVRDLLADPDLTLRRPEAPLRSLGAGQGDARRVCARVARQATGDDL